MANLKLVDSIGACVNGKVLILKDYSGNDFGADCPIWENGRSYKSGEYCRKNGVKYLSQSDGNQEEPGTGLAWENKGSDGVAWVKIIGVHAPNIRGQDKELKDVVIDCIQDWGNLEENGQLVAFNRENVERILNAYPILNDQIVKAILDIQSFLKVWNAT
jgi:hypothetical protein